MLGLDSAGKTTILYRLKNLNDLQTLPTVGFNVESVKYKGVMLNIWDVGGQDKIRALWRHYYAGSQGLIFVLDCADEDRFPEARREFQKIISNPDMKRAPILVFANKQDQKHSVNATNVPTMLGLDKLQDHAWFVQPSCASKGHGLEVGLNWLIEHAYKNQKKKR